MSSDLAGFAVAMAVITITPGADTALVVRNAVAGGARVGVLTAAGSALGLLAWGLASAVGLAALLAASAALFTVVKLAGAAYLVLLGVHALRHAGEEPRGDGRLGTARGPLVQGLVTNVLNPKAGLFFTALLPQFVSPQDPVLAVSGAMTVAAAAASLAWLALYSALLGRAGDVLRRPPVRRTLDRATGVVLVGLGVRVALSGRPGAA